MTKQQIKKIYLLLLWLGVTAVVVNVILYLLNSPSDLSIAFAVLMLVSYCLLSYQSKCFTQNPFKNGNSKG